MAESLFAAEARSTSSDARTFTASVTTAMTLPLLRWKMGPPLLPWKTGLLISMRCGPMPSTVPRVSSSTSPPSLLPGVTTSSPTCTEPAMSVASVR